MMRMFSTLSSLRIQHRSWSRAVTVGLLLAACGDVGPGDTASTALTTGGSSGDTANVSSDGASSDSASASATDGDPTTEATSGDPTTDDGTSGTEATGAGHAA